MGSQEGVRVLEGIWDTVVAGFGWVKDGSGEFFIAFAFFFAFHFNFDFGFSRYWLGWSGS